MLCLLLELTFDELADGVENEFVCLLNGRGDFARQEELNVGEAGALATSPSQKGDSVYLLIVRGHQRTTHVFTMTAGAEGNEHVPRLSEGANLAGEDVIELRVVADAVRSPPWTARERAG